ncbi:MAG: HD domain-containing protein [Candidatus Taylorbacteria bacterium]|nr:HD domain-containing protein [Candidatus Taylorbacteria bacterium]
MKELVEIYIERDIVPDLQIHQLRVASVAKIICDDFKINVDTDRIVKACLFHDMGNIIKFNMSAFPLSFEPLGVERWKKIKEKYIEKYGNDEHHANLMIAKEIGLDEKTVDIIDHIGFNRLNIVNNSGVYEYMIASYSDSRVVPTGVSSIAGRLEEGRVRYAEKIRYTDPEVHRGLVEALNSLEKLIFSECNIKPDDINDNSIRETIDSLWKIQL